MDERMAATASRCCWLVVIHPSHAAIASPEGIKLRSLRVSATTSWGSASIGDLTIPKITGQGRSP